jgi:hypothetical protein
MEQDVKNAREQVKWKERWSRMDIQVSLVASADRPVVQNGFRNWERFVNSLKGNKINYEVVFVGNTPCPYMLPHKFRWIKANVKPAQCYEIGFREAKGELIHWTADDADYVCKNPDTGQIQNNNLDRAYNKWKEVEAQYGNDKKTVIAMRPIEDGGDVWSFHHFFGGWQHTPVMAPFGLIHREWFVKDLGGYDRRFVSGQSENDVVMRAYEAGGRVAICMDAMVYVHHRQVHPRDPRTRKEANKFRDWYNTDREILERCWIPAGYGAYKDRSAGDMNVEISKKRLLPVERFEDLHITTQTQGPKGIW